MEGVACRVSRVGWRVAGHSSRWTDGRVEEWTGGRVEDWTGGRVDGWTDGRVEEWTSGRMDGWMVGWKNGRMEEWMGGRVDGWTDAVATLVILSGGESSSRSRRISLFAIHPSLNPPPASRIPQPLMSSCGVASQAPSATAPSSVDPSLVRRVPHRAKPLQGPPRMRRAAVQVVGDDESVCS